MTVAVAVVGVGGEGVPRCRFQGLNSIEMLQVCKDRLTKPKPPNPKPSLGVVLEIFWIYDGLGY